MFVNGGCNPRDDMKGHGGVVPDNTLTPSDQFPTLWVEIYGNGSWSSNPWIWVIEFKK